MSLTAFAFLLAFTTGAGLALFLRPIYGLYLYVAVFYLHPPSRWWGYDLPDLRWSLLAAAITLVSLIIRHDYKHTGSTRIASDDPGWLDSTIAKGLLAYTIWMWVQAPWVVSDVHMEGVILFTKYLLLFYLIYRVVDNMDDFAGFCLAHVAGCAYLGWLVYLAPDTGRLDGVGGPGIDDANSLGMQLSTGLFFAAFMMLGLKGWRRLFTIFALPFLINGIIQTETRGAILGILAGGMATVLLKPRQYRGRFYLFAILGLVGVLAVANETFLERMQTIRATVDDTSEWDASALGRIAVARAQLSMFADHPLGAGHQGTSFLSHEYLDDRWFASDSGDRSSHNTVLSILVDQGIIGIGIFIVLMFSIIRLLARMKDFDRSDLPDSFGLYRAALGGSVVVIYAAGMFTQFLKAEVQIWTLALLVVLWRLSRKIIADQSDQVRSQERSPQRSRRTSVPSQRVVAVFGLLCLPAMASGLGWSGNDFDGFACDGAGQGFGPWDFFDVDEPSDPNYYDGRWWEAVDVHAKPGFDAMNDVPFDQGAYNKAAYEFDYLLRSYPNHPQILQGVIQLELKRRGTPRRLIRFGTPPECYLIRASMFRPKQPHIPQLMGIYLQRLGDPKRAIEYYQHALGLNPNAAEIQYNLGLAYFELDEFRLAAGCARQAYKLGYPLRGLQSKLRRIDFDFDSLPKDLGCVFTRPEPEDPETEE